MKQKKMAAYRQSAEGKVSQVLKKLKETIKFMEKIGKLETQISKLESQITTEPEDNKKQNLRQCQNQHREAIKAYHLEMKQQHLDQNETQVQLQKIRDILESIQALPPLEENEKKIHKNLKNLNRFEEHLIILKARSCNENIIQELSQLINEVNIKKGLMILKLNQNEEPKVCYMQKKQQQFDETPTIMGDIDQNLNNLQINDQPKEQSQKPHSDEQKQLQKQEVINENDKCQICFHKKRKFVSIPCGHFIYCEDCKLQVIKTMTCLLCRQNVLQMIQVYE